MRKTERTYKGYEIVNSEELVNNHKLAKRVWYTKIRGYRVTGYEKRFFYTVAEAKAFIDRELSKISKLFGCPILSKIC